MEAVLARTHPEDSAALETMKRAVREKRNMDLNYKILLPDGTVRHIHSLAYPVVNQAGEVEFTGVCVDVTGRKLAEDALHRSLEQVRALAARVERVHRVLSKMGFDCHGAREAPIVSTETPGRPASLLINAPVSKFGKKSGRDWRARSTTSWGRPGPVSRWT